MKTRKSLFVIALLIGYVLGSKYPVAVYEDGSYTLGRQWSGFIASGCISWMDCGE